MLLVLAFSLLCRLAQTLTALLCLLTISPLAVCQSAPQVPLVLPHRAFAALFCRVRLFAE
jgi:hypothetical protein